MKKIKEDISFRNQDEIGIRYDLDLVETVSNILAHDFWVFRGFNAMMLPVLKDPIKFSANCSIYLKSGECEFEIDLIKYQVKGPAIINIRKSQILIFHSSSEDFYASFIVLSKPFCENLFLLLQDFPAYHAICSCATVNVPEALMSDFDKFYEHIMNIFNNVTPFYSYKAMLLAIASFFYECGCPCYEKIIQSLPKSKNKLSEKFISMVQQNFKKERFLNFYAQELGVSAKHLSKAVKEATGSTAVEWIDRYVILEAKVLLKSTNLTVQQIADELNFSSQSFFGKYFKKMTGCSPKEFRYI